MNKSNKPKGLALSEIFTRQARRWLAPVLVAGGMLIPQTGGEKKAEHHDISVTTDTARARPSETGTAAFAKQHRAIRTKTATNEDILKAAQDNFLALADLARTDYSAHLDSLAVSINNYLQRHPSMHSKTVIIDPIKLDVGRALGLGTEEIIQRLIGKDSIVKEARDATIEAADAEQSLIPGDYGYAPTPTTTVNLFYATPKLCVLLPTSDYCFIDIAIRGMTPQQKAEFINRHEAGHAEHSAGVWAGLDTAQLKNFSPDDPFAPAPILDYPDIAEALSRNIREEAYGDMRALGSMIQDGEDPAILQKAIQMRRKSRDGTHMSVRQLEGLSHYIDSIGIENFKAMPEGQTRALYDTLNALHGVSAAMLRINAAYDVAAPQEKEREDNLAAENPLHAAAKDFRNLTDRTKAYLVLPPPADPKLKEDVDAWDGAWQLIKGAAELNADKMLLPENIIKAYGRMQNDLAKKMAAEPYNPLYPAQRLRLQKIFIENLRNIDYAGAHKRSAVMRVAEKPAQK